MSPSRKARILLYVVIAVAVVAVLKLFMLFGPPGLYAKAEGWLRQALTKAGVAVPADVNLELAKYLNKRGVKGLMFKPDMEFKDPFGNQDWITPAASLGK